MTRSRMRLVLVLAGLVPLVLALLFALKVLVMLSHDRDGRSGFTDGNYLAAAGEFSSNGSLNWFEPWVSSFDEGAARHAGGDLDGALDLYGKALEDVPHEDECTVRINAALAHETLGDNALDDGAADGADEAQAQWQAGIDVLAEGRCPTDSGRGQDQTDDAAAVDKRLRDKLQQQQSQDQKPDKDKKKDQGKQQPQDDKDGGQSPEERRQQREEQRKERRLEKRNDGAIEEQQQYDDSHLDRDYSEYHW